VVLPGMRIHKELRLPNFKRGANEPLLAWPARIREAKGRADAEAAKERDRQAYRERGWPSG
jgi:hypothetical protein